MPSGHRGPSAKNVCWTWNNPEKEAEQALEALFNMPGCTYVVFQEEQGEEGTRHFQGYSEFSKQVRWTAFATALGVQPHCELRRGTQSQAIEYCSKADTRLAGPWSRGEPAVTRPGARTDLAAFRDSVVGGASKRELYDSYPAVMAKYPRFAHEVRMTYLPQAFKHRRVVLLYGTPGTGKTRYAMSDSPEGMLWTTPIGGGMWFDGLDHHTHCLLDDFMGRGSKFSLADLLRLLDGNCLQVQVKGAHTLWHPDVIYITTNYHPRDWYDWETRRPSWGALKRRFTEVHLFGVAPEAVVMRADDLMTAAPYEEFWTLPPPKDTRWN